MAGALAGCHKRPRDSRKAGETACPTTINHQACQGFFCGLLVALFLLSGCGLRRDEAAIRKELRAGSVLLPAGVIEIHAELALPDGAHDIEIAGDGSILRAAKDFRGRAMFSSKSGARIRFRDFTIDGDRDAIEQL